MPVYIPKGIKCLYDPRDVMLLAEYGHTEGHDALGLTGAYSVSHPTNYAEQDVESYKMQYQDAAGIPQPDCLDYLVYRSSINL